MSDSLSLVELDAKSRTFLREGKVLSGGGASEVAVEWPDGMRETVGLGVKDGRLRMTVQTGTLRYRKFVDPEGLRVLLEQDPVAVFVLALRQGLKAQSSKDLIDKVVQEFPQVDASALWSKIRQAFEAHSEVRSAGTGAKLRYRIEPSQLTETSSSWGEPTVEPRDGVGPAFGNDMGADREAPRVSLSAENPRGAQAHPGSSASEKVGKRLSDSAGEAAQSAAAVDLVKELRARSRGKTGSASDSAVRRLAFERGPAVSMVAEALTNGLSDQVTVLMAHALDTPVASGVQLGHFPDEVLVAAFEKLPPNAAALGLAIPRPSKISDSLDAVKLLGDMAATRVLERAQEELLTMAAPPDAMNHLMKRGGANLVRRTVEAPGGAVIKADKLLRAVSAVAPIDDAAGSDEWTAKMLARALEAAAPGDWPRVADSERRAIAKQASRARLQPSGGRLSLLVWLARQDRVALRDPVWWDGVSFDDLSAVGSTSLAVALEDDHIRRNVVAPLAATALSEAVTRSRLFVVLAAPLSVARGLSPTHVQEHVTRVLQGDELSRRWLSAITDAENTLEVERELDRTQAREAALRESAEAAGEASQVAEDRINALAERLRGAEADSDRFRASKSRQIRLDTLRAMATLGAYVQGAVGSQSPDRISQRINSLLRREGLEPIGFPGERTEYLPARHELIGTALDAGSPVIIRGVGYILVDGEEVVVLERAIVEAIN
ncbi:MAG: hypothetical protein L0H96_01845 [Humibacillus sp.]|nr:hypothetical protein [Humibacillus sp.]MDN5775636.1 hypothetical protein [Humibacillus sp.]